MSARERGRILGKYACFHRLLNVGHHCNCIRLNHNPPCWTQRHLFSYESEATRVKTIMAESMSTSSEFWHRNLVDIPLFTSAFIDKMASENLPVKVTLTRGYKFFHESYIHDVEGKLSDVTALSVIAR